MLLTFLSRLMSSLLTFLLFLTVVGYTANQTVLNTTYIENKLESQNAYSRLSDALSDEISKNSSDPAISQDAVSSQLKTILTPDVLKQKIDTTLKQLQAYYKGDGPEPTLDVSDLIKQANQSGLTVDSAKFDKPVTLNGTAKLKQVGQTAKLVGIGTAVLMALLFLGVLAIAIKRRNYKPLANIVFSLGIMLTTSGLLMLFVPRLFSHFLKIDAATNPFAALAHDLAVVAMHDFGIRLLIPGVVALLLGILAKFALRGTGRKQPKAKKQKEVVAEDSSFFDNREADSEPAAPAAEPTPLTPTPSTEPAPRPGPAPGAPPRPRGPRKIQL